MKNQEDVKNIVIHNLNKLHKQEKIIGTCVFLLLNIASILILDLIFIIGYLLFSTFFYISFLKGIKQKYDKKFLKLNK
jgi:hypothetical protein